MSASTVLPCKVLEFNFGFVGPMGFWYVARDNAEHKDLHMHTEAVFVYDGVHGAVAVGWVLSAFSRPGMTCRVYL